jgi:uncharacterized protein YdcH (DUF465 family)
MHYSELLEKIEEMRTEMYIMFNSDDVYASLLDTSQQLDDLIVRYYRIVS